jgi:PAS domain S-box-containing protein
MPIAGPSLPVDGETLAIEIAALLSHYRSLYRRAAFGFLGTDAYPRLLPLTRAAVSATVKLSANHARIVSSAFGELGVLAASMKVDAADLMAVCTDTLQRCERHIGRACPALARADGWVSHWTTLNSVACRAAIFGHGRASFSSDDGWLVALHDASVPRIKGVSACDVAADELSGESLVVAASERVDVGDSAVIATDVSGTILYWNERASNLYGWTLAEVRGQNILDVTPSLQSRNEAERVMRELLGGRPWSGDFICKKKGGTPLRAHVTDLPVSREGQIVGILGLSAGRYA